MTLLGRGPRGRIGWSPLARSTSFQGARFVLYFYPKDDTPGCTKEACGFRDVLPDLKARGASVLGVSPDGAVSHRKFKDKYGLNFPLLSDPDHAVAEGLHPRPARRARGGGGRGAG